MKKLLLAAALVIAVFVAVPAHADMDSDLAEQIDQFSAMFGLATNPEAALNDPALGRAMEQNRKWRKIEDQCYAWAKLNYQSRDVQRAKRYCMDENGHP